MIISFGDGAFEAYIEAVNRIPVGYTVSLLGHGQEPPTGTDLVPGIDVSFVGAGPDGVNYKLIDSVGEITSAFVHLRTWDRVARVHVY